MCLVCLLFSACFKPTYCFYFFPEQPSISSWLSVGIKWPFHSSLASWPLFLMSPLVLALIKRTIACTFSSPSAAPLFSLSKFLFSGHYFQQAITLFTLQFIQNNACIPSAIFSLFSPFLVAWKGCLIVSRHALENNVLLRINVPVWVSL